MIEITCIGNVGSTRFNTSAETTVLNVSIASSRKVRDTEYTDWVSAKIWGDRGERLKDIIAVGQKLMIRGRPQAGAYRRGDGTLAGDMIVHVRELEFIGPRPKSSQGNAPQQQELTEVTPPAKSKRQRKPSQSAA